MEVLFSSINQTRKPIIQSLGHKTLMEQGLNTQIFSILYFFCIIIMIVVQIVYVARTKGLQMQNCIKVKNFQAIAA